MDLGSDAFRLGFGLVKEIVAEVPPPEQTRLRQLMERLILRGPPQGGWDVSIG